ncbi:putative leucine-rich repeat-containing protein DDB_G0290503 [Drosophila kikkawai]|uniref:Leucine-rich repeat-containing protein DDB_G0290503 n=1 Tax=Drosophila kikkawai TaxID=30033 RepID=A0ABM4GPN9_DROKI
MPRKGQQNPKSPVAMPSRKSSRSPGCESSQEKPPIAVETQKNSATSEAKRLPVETSKMADNCKDLKVSEVAHSEGTVASASKSTLSQLEVFQTRQALRSPDVSSKKETADINAAKAPPARAPKRSGTPVPKSFFEDKAKKIRMTPTQLGLDSPKPTQLEGESYHKSDPKPNQNQENNNKENENPDILRLTNETNADDAPMADIEIASCQSMWIAAKGLLASSGYDMYYLNQFQKFYDNYRACNIKTAKRLLTLVNSNTEKHYANISLKSRLNEMAINNKSLANKLALQEQLGMELHDKYINALKMRVDIEKNYKNQVQVANTLIDQQKLELDKNQSELDRFKAELSNMASDFTDLQQKLKQTEATAANLLNENNKQAAELEEQKVKLQDTNKCYQLDAELRDKTLECDGLNQQALDFEELMLFNNEMAARLEELEATQTSLVEVNDEFARESETISSLMSILDKQSQDLTKLIESQEKLEIANFQQASLHSAERQECEAQKLELQETIKSLQNMLKDQGQVLQAEQEKLAKANHQSLGLKTELDGEKERHQADITALKTALEHRDRASSAEQAKMQSLVAELDELKKVNTNLKDEKKQMGNQLAATKEKYEDQLKEQMNEMIALQEDLENKKTKLIALEHEKDGIIKQLKTKMNTICSTITQPIVGSTEAKSPQPTKYSKRLHRKTQPEAKPAVNKPSSSAKERNAKISIYSSETESEDDVPLKTLFAKRENLAVVKPQNDVFDALKKGTI